ncbi:MAG: hypothetical protein ACE367_03580 [Acidimicrobiales bacterium]
MTMTTTTTEPARTAGGHDNPGRLTRAGGAAALLAAGTFAFGIAMFATTFADYTDPDASAAESVDFLVDHQLSLLAWYIGIFIVFGAALVPMALALRARLVQRTPILADTAAVFAMVWAGLMIATGMISNIGIEAVADLADTDPDQAAGLWSSIDTVTNGLGGGNELVGGIWILLVSIAGLISAGLPRWLNIVGVVTAIAGVVTVVPELEAVEMVFGVGSIIWFIGVGATLLRSAGSRSSRSRANGGGDPGRQVAGGAESDHRERVMGQACGFR